MHSGMHFLPGLPPAAVAEYDWTGRLYWPLVQQFNEHTHKCRHKRTT